MSITASVSTRTNKIPSKLVIEDYSPSQRTVKAPVDPLAKVIELAHGNVQGARAELLPYQSSPSQTTSLDKILNNINENYKKNILIKTEVYVKRLRTVLGESPKVEKKVSSFVQNEWTSRINQAINDVYDGKEDSVSSFLLWTVSLKIKTTQKDYIKLAHVFNEVNNCSLSNIVLTEDHKNRLIREVYEILIKT